MRSNISIGTVRNIVNNILKYRKVCCQWVPRLVSKRQKKTEWASVYSICWATSMTVTTFYSTYQLGIEPGITLSNQKGSPSVCNGNISTKLDQKI
ncbi:hypothetical protein TNCV_2348891 [Trichonephila clavipes]|uniref:Uncharacterized protein n=1 Tax=Trichonephila clavipes TaxID=2585209 RepID=A0A8X6SM54_TRICX|nr:hypothetical protein TNCV_2348891 [Trichonephila clavipes]